MGLRDLAAVLTGERSERAAPPPLFDLLTGRYAGGVSSSSAAVGYDEAQAHGAVYACVDLLVRLVAWQMPAYIGDQPARATVVADPHPEPQMLAEHWRAEVLQAAMLRGYAAGIVTEYEASGWPRKILPVHPDLISWYEVERGRWGWFCDGQQMELWQTARGPLWIAPAPRVTPGQPVGASVLRYAAQKIKLGLTATKFAGDYFTAGGVPVAHGKVLNTAELTEQQAETLKDRIVRATSSRRPLITGSNFELDTIQVTAEESQFLETIKANVAEVCMFFGVPPESIGGSSGDSMTYANVEGRNLALLTNTVGAWMAWLERLYTRMLPRPQSVTLDPESLLRTSVPTLYDTVQKGVGRGGTPSVLTQNEGRAMLGYGPVEGGDTLFVPATFLPPADANEEMPSDGEPTATP